MEVGGIKAQQGKHRQGEHGQGEHGQGDRKGRPRGINLRRSSSTSVGAGVGLSGVGTLVVARVLFPWLTSPLKTVLFMLGGVSPT
jgi:hypothetical protein